jgi:hypothetical protein
MPAAYCLLLLTFITPPHAIIVVRSSYAKSDDLPDS